VVYYGAAFAGSFGARIALKSAFRYFVIGSAIA
jgi:hypothetical protein